MNCTHPSWDPANDGSGRRRCGICGALGSERRYLEVEGESRMPLIPSELLLIVHDPLIGPALLELLRRVKQRLDGVATRDECGWAEAEGLTSGVMGAPVAVVTPYGATVRLQWASTEAAHNAKPGPLYAAAGVDLPAGGQQHE